MSELELIPNEELLDELVGRFDDAAFVGQKDRTSMNKEFTYAGKGCPHTQIGLCVHLMARSVVSLFQGEGK